MHTTRRALAGAVFALALAPEIALAQDGVNLGEGFEATGAVGVRYEMDAAEPGASDIDHRLRLTASLGTRFRATEWLSIFARVVAVGDGDARDAYVELGDGVNQAGVAFDRAYLHFQRGALAMSAGLVEHPAGTSSILWDRDISPSGGWISYSRRIGRVTLTPLAFAYLVRSDRGGRPAGLLGGELAAQALVGDADIDIAWATYQLARKNALAGPPTRNALDERGNFVSDYEIIEGRARIKSYSLLPLPVELVADVYVNLGAEAGERSAYSGGIIGRIQGSKLSSQLSYRYRIVERDAVIAKLAGDDFRLETAVSGHSVELITAPDDRVSFGASAFIFENSDGDDPTTAGIDEGRQQLRVRGDIIVTF